MGKHYLYSHYGEEYKIKVEIAEYQNGQKAILLESVDEEFGGYEPFMTASVALERPIEDGNVYIKNYSENSGVLNFLVENSIVSEPLYSVNSGFVDIPVCKLLLEIE